MITSKNDSRTLILKLEGQAFAYVSSHVIVDQYGSVEDIVVDGRRWHTRNVPLITEADILYERGTRFFIGLTFAIHDPTWEMPALATMLEGLDPDAIRVTDYSDPSVAAAYPESCRSVPYLEVRWSPSKDYAYECAQLLYGAWAFGYPVPNPSLFRDPLPWTRPIGFVVADISEHASDHNLRCPDQLIRSAAFRVTSAADK